MSLHDRYLAGQHAAVWMELRALGADVRRPETLAAARAVALLTMERVRLNLERIEQGLRDAGCIFGWGPPSTSPAGPGFPIVPQLSEGIRHTIIESPAARSGETHSSQAAEHQTFIRPDPSHVHQMERFERMAGPIPLSLRAFWEEAGGIDLMGRMRGWTGSAFDWDPLVIYPADELADTFDEEAQSGQPFSYILAPERTTKGGSSGGVVGIPLPDAGADFQLPTGKWFVDFLRDAIQMAGFPGFGEIDQLPAELKSIASEWTPF